MHAALNLIWSSDPRNKVRCSCLACGESSEMTLKCEVNNLYSQPEKIKFVRCARCGSLNALSSAFFEFTDSTMSSAHWNHYLHIGAGIDFMIRPIQRVANARKISSLLDVGCGFGYTIDYCHYSGLSKVVGVEPSTYGRMGRDMLSTPIEIAYLDEVEKLKGERFDVVFSSEVIEHVPDPRVFLRNLKDHLQTAGVLILTTPNSEFIEPGSISSMVAAALSPGLHKILFSSQALRQLLVDVGFTEVLIETQEERLLAFASLEPLKLALAGRLERNQYLAYLLRRSSDPTPHSDVEIGFRFRAFKELVNAGRVSEARLQAEAFQSLMREIYHYDPTDRAQLDSKILTITSFVDYERCAPYCFGPFLFYYAMMKRVAGDSAKDAAAWFHTATKVLDHMISLEPMVSQEASSLIWRSLMEEGFALTAAQEWRAARSIFSVIQNFSEATSEALRISHVPADVLTRTRLEDKRAQSVIEGGAQ